MERVLVMMNDNVGIVVIGRNEGVRLVRCLTSCIDKTIHLIYVDSGSTDESVSIAEGLDINVEVLDTSLPFTAARARNEGFDILTNGNPEIKFVHFIDGDCELDDEWLAHATATLSENEDVALIHGRLREKDIEKSIYTKLADISWYREPGMNREFGGIFTIRCDVFKYLNGFDSKLIAGEEPELFQRLLNQGYQTLCIDHTMGTHDFGVSSFYEWWSRTVRTGFAYANVEKWNGWKGQQLKTFLWATFFPIIIVLSVLKMPYYGWACLLIYPIQMVRIFLKLNIPYGKSDRLLYAGFCVIDKFPQMFGVIKYHYVNGFDKEQKIIEYKQDNKK